MFKVIDLGPEGKPEESEDPGRVAPPPPGRTRWVDIVNAGAESLDLLRRRFDFHPLALDDCSTFDTRSKLDEYKGHLFIALHPFTSAPDDPTNIQVHEVQAGADPMVLGRGNFKAVPFGDSRVMWILSIGLCAGVPAALLIWFAAKRWL